MRWGGGVMNAGARGLASSDVCARRSGRLMAIICIYAPDYGPSWPILIANLISASTSSSDRAIIVSICHLAARGDHHHGPSLLYCTNTADPRTDKLILRVADLDVIMKICDTCTCEGDETGMYLPQ